MENIFRSLSSKQLPINFLKEDTEDKDLDNKYSYLNLFDSKYSTNLFFILFLLKNKNNLLLTPDEQVKTFENFLLNLIDEFNKQNFFIKFNYNKNILIKKKNLFFKILNKNLNGYDLIKLFVDYLNVNIFIDTGDYIFKFINNINSNNYMFNKIDNNYKLIYLNKDKYNLDKDNINLDNKIIIEEEVFISYKKYKLLELTELCSRLKINNYIDGKKKNKKQLLLDIEKIINYI